ncbi:MAG: DUF4276 family protein [Dehalococcoidales bacterium]|nr:DUF4276 family protein [Dehalococcoidales bacterium]
MPTPIPIQIVVEDELSDALIRRILKESHNTFAVGISYGKCGYVYIKEKVGAFNEAARGTPFLVLSDLEEAECAPTQMNEWLQIPKHHNLLFRIAVREIESWLLADRSGFAYFLNIRKELIPENVDGINNPKQLVISLARRSRKRTLREAIVPIPDSTARVGPDYNGQLSLFVFNTWNIVEAIKHSDSLRRAVNAINNFQPIWT